jgi:hypothetical protein
MKNFIRKPLFGLIVLISTILFWSCITIYYRSTSSQNNNINLTVRVASSTNNTGMGFVLECKQGNCLVITTAHICNPEIVFGNLRDAYLSRQLSEDELREEFAILSNGGAFSGFCKAKIFELLSNSEEKFNTFKLIGEPLYVDFNKDLLLLQIKHDDMGKIQFANDPSTGDNIHIISSPIFEMQKIIIYARVGLKMRLGPDNTNAKDYIQTQFGVGPGASGSPVFNESNKLVGIYGAEIFQGVAPAFIRSSLVIPVSTIKGFMSKYVEAKDANQSRRISCVGEDVLCQVVQGELSFLDYMQIRRDAE